MKQVHIFSGLFAAACLIVCLYQIWLLATVPTPADIERAAIEYRESAKSFILSLAVSVSFIIIFLRSAKH